jgi:hypothetical protein
METEILRRVTQIIESKTNNRIKNIVNDKNEQLQKARETERMIIFLFIFVYHASI